MKSNTELTVYLILFCVLVLNVSLLNLVRLLVNRKHYQITTRLKELHLNLNEKRAEDILARPFLDRTIGELARKLVEYVSKVTPKQAIARIDDKLEKAGRPKGVRASDFLVIQGLLGITVLLLCIFIFPRFSNSGVRAVFLAVTFSVLVVYVCWFYLAKLATNRQRNIGKGLPDIMDLLVVSVEAGLAFDMALLKVVERFHGPVGEEFHRVLRELQLGRPRKQALKSMAERVDLPELTSLVNAIVQSEQLGVGLSSVLRVQSDLIREKRQQQVEEKAMKAPVKMLFPLVFCIFPSMFIVILGPAILNILKVLGGN